MTKRTGYVVQGDDNDNKLKAVIASLDDQIVFYNIVYGAGGNDTIKVDDAFTGRGVGAELYGEDGNDVIWDHSASWDQQHKDTLSGGAGDDIIYSQGGLDVIDGGDGVDTLFVSKITLGQSPIPNIEILHADRITVDGGDLGQFQEVHALRVHFAQQADLSGQTIIMGHSDISGSKFGDKLDLSSSDAKLSIRGSDGDDVVSGGSKASELSGDGGNDTVTGGAGNDSIIGGRGDDAIDGGDGNDTITDVVGDNTVHGGGGQDILIGGDITEQFNTPKYHTTSSGLFDGGKDDDLFEGFKGTVDVTLVGGKGDDTLEFKGDASHLHVSGIETLELQPYVQKDFEVTAPITASVEFLNSFKHITTFADQTAAAIHLADGGTFRWHDPHDRLYGLIEASNEGNKVDLTQSQSYWTVTGGRSDDVIVLGNGGQAYGAGGDDRIIGGNGYDDIRGAEGNDTIDGRGGNDELQGDGGRDTFVFQAGSGKDTIYDFDATSKSHDVIDLSAIKTISSFDDLVKHHLSEGGDLTISLGGGDKIYLSGVYKDQIDPSLFIL